MRQFTFASLQVRDLEASSAFYTEKLGFERSDMKNPDAVIFKYNQGAASFAIRKPLEDIEKQELGKGVSLWFAIDGSIDVLHASLIKKGVTILGTIMETPFGKAFHVKDPDGYKLTFLQPNH
jgi:lactoylglutathione lyase